MKWGVRKDFLRKGHFWIGFICFILAIFSMFDSDKSIVESVTDTMLMALGIINMGIGMFVRQEKR